MENLIRVFKEFQVVSKSIAKRFEEISKALNPILIDIAEFVKLYEEFMEQVEDREGFEKWLEENDGEFSNLREAYEAYLNSLESK